MDIRDRLLKAAATVYAESGFRGATTRRIAQVADVNEITLFRHFGSKEVLIHEAIRASEITVAPLAPLPDVPRDPRAELTEWSRTHVAHLREVRSLILTCLGELDERPELGACASHGPRRTMEALETYLAKLRDSDLADTDLDSRAAAALLMGTLFGDAMGRELVAEMYPKSSDEAVDRYVELFLRAIGARSHRDDPREDSASPVASTSHLR